MKRKKNFIIVLVPSWGFLYINRLQFLIWKICKFLVPSWGFLYINEKTKASNINIGFSSPHGDFFILTRKKKWQRIGLWQVLVPSWGFLYINRKNSRFSININVLVPSWGFLYINIQNSDGLLSAEMFSSPHGDFFILTMHEIDSRCFLSLFSSPHGDFFILTASRYINDEEIEYSSRPLMGISLY